MTQPTSYDTSPFDAIRHEDAQGEYWLARELATMLEYVLWQNFENAIKKAIKACEGSGNQVTDHFIDLNKMIHTGKGAQREVHDYRLTRYACYLIAQNGDSSKEVIARAQTYFAVMTREQEMLRGLISQVDDNPLREIALRIDRRKATDTVHRLPDSSATLEAC